MKQTKSVLIDSIYDNYSYTTSEINGKWYYAKPIQLRGWFMFLRRLNVAWRVLIGKSFAVHFKVDE